MAAASPAHLIGVSTAKTKDFFFIRFHLGDEHIDRFKSVERFEIRGQASNGFIIAPNKKGIKILRGGLRSGAYLQSALTHFELSKRLRRRVNVRPTFESGHLRIPPLPPAWIDAAAEFDGEGAPELTENAARAAAEALFGEGPVTAKLHASPGNGISRISSESIQLNGSPTAPLPKPTPDYAVPASGDMPALQTELAQHISAAKGLIEEMQRRTGMKFVLDRNLRLVVAL
jgi:hypothetical protein